MNATRPLLWLLRESREERDLRERTQLPVLYRAGGAVPAMRLYATTVWFIACGRMRCRWMGGSIMSTSAAGCPRGAKLSLKNLPMVRGKVETNVAAEKSLPWNAPKKYRCPILWWCGWAMGKGILFRFVELGIRCLVNPPQKIWSNAIISEPKRFLRTQSSGKKCKMLIRAAPLAIFSFTIANFSGDKIPRWNKYCSLSLTARSLANKMVLFPNTWADLNPSARHQSSQQQQLCVMVLNVWILCIFKMLRFYSISIGLEHINFQWIKSITYTAIDSVWFLLLLRFPTLASFMLITKWISITDVSKANHQRMEKE